MLNVGNLHKRLKALEDAASDKHVTYTLADGSTYRMTVERAFAAGPDMLDGCHTPDVVAMLNAVRCSTDMRLHSLMQMIGVCRIVREPTAGKC